MSNLLRRMARDPDEEEAVSGDEAVYGPIAPKIPTDKLVAKPISIFGIQPDPVQPRRAVPTSVRWSWEARGWTLNSGSIASSQCCGLWVDLANEERGGAADLVADLMAGKEVERPEEIGPIEHALLAVVDLSVSIGRDGLTNPITVVRLPGGRLRIETGERRWLAHHFLAAMGDEKYLKIAAREVDDFNVWRQATENSQRDDLNAVGKARQFALLLMDLLASEKHVQFAPLDSFQNEVEFYAQVADARPPHGKGEKLMNAMGVTSRQSVSFYRDVLRLPPDVWHVADDENWSLRAILDWQPGQLSNTFDNSNELEDTNDFAPENPPASKPKRAAASPPPPKKLLQNVERDLQKKRDLFDQVPPDIQRQMLRQYSAFVADLKKRVGR